MKTIYLSLLAICLAAPAAAQLEQYFEREIPVATSEITAARFSNDGRLLVYGTKEGRLFIWDLSTAALIGEMDHHKGKVNALVFDAADRYLVSGADDKNIVVWDLQTREPLTVIKDFKSALKQLNLSPNGKFLAACGGGKEIFLWDFPSGHFRGKLTGHGKDVVFCAFNERSDQVVSVGGDRKIIVWDAGTLQPVRQYEVAVHTLANSGNEISSAVLSADRRFLAIGVEEHVLAKGSERMEFRYHTAFYNWPDGTLLKVLQGNDCVLDKLSLTPDMTYLLTDNSTLHDSRVTFWDILGGVAEKNNPIDGKITAFDLSLDGKWLAVGIAGKGSGKESTLALWKIQGIGAYTPVAEATLAPVADASFGGKVSLTGPAEPLIPSGQPRVLAVMYLEPLGIDSGVARFITEDIESRLVNNCPDVKVVERNQIDQIVRELRYVQSGLTETQAIEIGRHLAAAYLMIGSVQKMGHDLSITVKLVSVETSAIVGTRGVICTNASMRDIFDMVSVLAPTIAKLK